jgi:hypothetical protein
MRKIAAVFLSIFMFSCFGYAGYYYRNTQTISLTKSSLMTPTQTIISSVPIRAEFDDSQKFCRIKVAGHLLNRCTTLVGGVHSSHQFKATVEMQGQELLQYFKIVFQEAAASSSELNDFLKVLKNHSIRKIPLYCNNPDVAHRCPILIISNSAGEKIQIHDDGEVSYHLIIDPTPTGEPEEI